MTRCGLALLSYSSLKCSLEESMSVIIMIRGDGDSRTRFPRLFWGISDAAPVFVALFEVNLYALSLLLFVSSLCF